MARRFNLKKFKQRPLVVDTPHFSDTGWYDPRVIKKPRRKIAAKPLPVGEYAKGWADADRIIYPHHPHFVVSIAYEDGFYDNREGKPYRDPGRGDQVALSESAEEHLRPHHRPRAED